MFAIKYNRKHRTITYTIQAKLIRNFRKTESVTDQPTSGRRHILPVMKVQQLLYAWLLHRVPENIYGSFLRNRLLHIGHILKTNKLYLYKLFMIDHMNEKS